jgi:transposase
MFNLGSQHDYYLYRGVCDMRKGFDGLCGIVSNELGRSPLDGSVFIFVNRNRSLIKLLHWERGGMVLYHKRLEQGRFTMPSQSSSEDTITWHELVLMIEGISYTSLKKKKRFEIKKEEKIC